MGSWELIKSAFSNILPTVQSVADNIHEILTWPIRRVKRNWEMVKSVFTDIIPTVQSVANKINNIL